MTVATNRLGRLGEDLAVRHLEALGCVVVARNWRAAVEGVRGEVDVVVRDGATLVFCEVKSRRTATLGDEALGAVTWSKQRQLRRLAGLWLAAHGDGRTGDVRFDVVGVTWTRAAGDPHLVHVRGAF